jgi:hypothetical protein
MLEKVVLVFSVQYGLTILNTDLKKIFLNAIHCPVFYLNDNVSDTGFCLFLQVKPIQLNLTYIVSTYLREYT